MLIGIIVVLLPFWLLFINSFKDIAAASHLGFGLPIEWHPENYAIVFKEGKFVQGLLNTLLIVIVVIPSTIIIASLASWIFARSKSKIFSILYYIAISGILIPPSLIITIFVMKTLNIYGTRYGVMLFYIGLFMSFSIFFLTGFIKSIPLELEESSRMDGASHAKVFFYIIFPLLKPVTITIGIFLLVGVWNDFIYPFFFLTESAKFTLVLGLNNFWSSTMFVPNWHLVFAYLILVNMPLLLFYFFAQRLVVSGIMAGAVKQ